MKRILVAALMLATAACSSISLPGIGSGPPAGFKEEMVSTNRYRIVYKAPDAVKASVISNRTLQRAAQLTLDKGNDWFEIASKIDSKNSQTLVIVMGQGETLAGGASKIYDAKDTLASLKGKTS